VAEILADAENLLPVVSLVVSADAAALVDGSPAQAALFTQLQKDITEALGLNSEDIGVTGARAAPAAGRRLATDLELKLSPEMGRRLQSAHLQFDFVIRSDDPSATLVELGTQLSNPESSLRNSPAAGAINSDLELSISFTCPFGFYRPEGAADCTTCSGDAIPEPKTQFTTCTECPASQSPDPTSSNTRCSCSPSYASADATSAGFYNTSLMVKCHTMDWSNSAETQLDGSGIPFLPCDSCGKIACVDECQSDSLLVAKGWSAITSYDSTGQPHVGIFACKYSSACKGGLVTNGVLASGRRLQEKTTPTGVLAQFAAGNITGGCEVGYTGVSWGVDPCHASPF
jgi:hypothetical protein